MTAPLTATYRLQLTPRFTLSHARRAVPYFAKLGVSHLYLSPLLAARAGSQHGYDVIDHSRINSELGSEDDLRALAAELATHGMGIVLDIVPNHMSATVENRAWTDVLERGSASRHADWFDIEWTAPRASGKVVLPVLGDDLEAVIAREEIRLVVDDAGAHAVYFEKRFPLDRSSLPDQVQLALNDPAARVALERWHAGEEGRKRIRTLLDRQHYRLTAFRRVHELNYRRFFDVTDLAALRMETDAVFDATHALVLRWVREGLVHGLRVDHVDGLASPAWYLGKLRAALDQASPAERAPIFVEKILTGDETLPHDWPVDGTTGYEFLNDVSDLFHDAAGYAAIEAAYRTLRRDPTLRFATIAREAKRKVLQDALLPDVLRLARVAHEWRPAVGVDDAAAAITECIAALDVYRTYVVTPGVVSKPDARVLQRALDVARTTDVSRKALDLVRDAFFATPKPADRSRAAFVSRFQQTSGPAAAKGVEDTALYVYVPLASRNEVGGAPGSPLENAAARVHERNALRARDWPRTLVATNTHDTKRSADLRSRLSVLTTHSADWSRYVSRWRKLNRRHKRVLGGRPSPDTRSEYLFYQTLTGMWPAERRGRRLDDLPLETWIDEARQRLSAYMLKAAREAKTRTSWTERDAEYESALDAFVKQSLAGKPDDPFLMDVARLAAIVAPAGNAAALARVAIHFTAPGTPDLYQGDELWTFTLVDPDNRRDVDFAARARLLLDVGDGTAVLREAFAGERPLSDDTVKLALTHVLLRFRREHASLVREGDYVPLATRPADAAFVFTRRTRDETCITIARTRPPSPASASPVTLTLPRELGGEWQSVLTRSTTTLVADPREPVADMDDMLPGGQPCDVLYRRNG
jgi:(1->4)-alpha-D-glucan 1-alpha-D-glucosylmutase